jgi:transposase-like protein
MEHAAVCPYCGERVTLWVEPEAAREQRYVEDCPVCCRPWQVRVVRDDDGEPSVVVAHADA